MTTEKSAPDFRMAISELPDGRKYLVVNFGGEFDSTVEAADFMRETGERLIAEGRSVAEAINGNE